MFKAIPAVFVVLLSGTSIVSMLHAMEIQRFDKMAGPDQKEYFLELLDGAQNVLREEGHADLAEKVAKLFTTNAPESNISIGMSQFFIALAKARVADLERLKKDSTAPRLEVEHAMILTLKKNGIELPKTFMSVMKDFKPKFASKDEKE